jgi:hypothetical protein
MTAIDGIIKFNVDRRLTTFDADAEYNMLLSELQEFLTGVAEEDEHDIVDALCDVMVVAAGALYKLGYKPEEALQETVKEISSRTGSFDKVTRKWQKDINQYPPTLYKADYTKARR